MTSNPPPQCNPCGKVMVEVGRKEHILSYMSPDGLKEIKEELFILYQCPECKDIKLN